MLIRRRADATDGMVHKRISMKILIVFSRIVCCRGEEARAAESLLPNLVLSTSLTGDAIPVVAVDTALQGYPRRSPC